MSTLSHFSFSLLLYFFLLSFPSYPASSTNDGEASFFEYGADRTLSLFGPSFKILQDTRQNSTIECVSFSFVEISRVLRQVVHLSRFPRLKRLILNSNDVKYLWQLSALKLLSIHHLTISDTALISLPCLRPFLSSALPSLKSVNGKPLTSSERYVGDTKFQAMTALVNNPSLRSQYNISAYGTGSRSSRSRRSSKAYVDSLVGEVVHISERLQAIDNIWEETLNQFIQDTITHSS